jgi:hypothetical protein
LTRLRDYVINENGRRVWHGDDDLELQCEQALSGSVGQATIVAPNKAGLTYKTVECGAGGRWLTNPETRSVKAGNKVKHSGPNWPNNLRVFEAQETAPEAGKEGDTYIPIVDDIGAALDGMANESGWVLYLGLGIVIFIIIIVGVVAVKKA